MEQREFVGAKKRIIGSWNTPSAGDMSQKNVDAIRRVYEGVNAQLEPPRKLFGPTYEVDALDTAPDFGLVRGFDTSQNAFRPYWQMFEDFRVKKWKRLLRR